ncbi:MAG: cupin domain-containing protein [Chloroflexota bacterium]
MKKHRAEGPSCDWRAPSFTQRQENRSRVLRYRGNFRWSGVRRERYKDEEEGWSAIARHVLTGNRGETSKFHLRYFEISPRGYSSLERHRHEHVVVCIRGRGEITLGGRSHGIGYLDTVYVAPDAVHQLRNPHDEPFGFLCIVNAKRDRPKPVTPRRQQRRHDTSRGA